MARSARNIKDGVCYYIYSSSYQDDIIYHEDEDFKMSLSLLKILKSKYAIKIFAYCLNATSLHLLIFPDQAKCVSDFMRDYNLSYAKFFNKKYAMQGKVWGDRFKSVSIESDADLFSCKKYIESLSFQHQADVSVAQCVVSNAWGEKDIFSILDVISEQNMLSKQKIKMSDQGYTAHIF